MSAASITLRGRAAAEALMLDAVTVQHQTGTTESAAGVVTPTYATVYAGKAKIQQATPAPAPTDVGQAAVFVGTLQLHLPVTVATAAVAPDDLVTVTSCVLDASLAGKTFRLRGPAHKSYATARRFPMVEVSG
jgi:hypothetical protein